MADAGEAIGLRIFGKLDAGCSSSDTKQEMPDMIWNDSSILAVVWRTAFSCSRAKLALRSSLPHQGS